MKCNFNPGAELKGKKQPLEKIKKQAVVNHIAGKGII